jgi:hypothetical protein
LQQTLSKMTVGYVLQLVTFYANRYFTFWRVCVCVCVYGGGGGLPIDYRCDNEKKILSWGNILILLRSWWLQGSKNAGH